MVEQVERIERLRCCSDAWWQSDIRIIFVTIRNDGKTGKMNVEHFGYSLNVKSWATESSFDT